MPTADERLMRAFRRVLRRIKPIEGSGDMFQRQAHYLRFAERTCRGIVLTTKTVTMRIVAALPQAARSLDVVCRYGLPTPDDIWIVEQWVKGRGVPIRFVGDIDPLDHAVYFTYRTALQREGIDLPHASARWLKPKFRNRDPWREWMEECVDAPDEPFERELLVGLRDLPMDWSEWVGPEAAAMLRAGSKVELEAMALHRPQSWRVLLARSLCSSRQTR